MNSWLKTGKGMMSQLIDVVASAPQPMPITKRSNKRTNNKNNNDNNNNNNNNNNTVLFTSLNQDCSYVCCGTSNGFRIFRSKPFEQIFESQDIIPLKLTMLFDKSLIAILTEKIDKKKIEIEEKIEKEYQLQLYDIKNREFIWSISPSIDGYDGSLSIKNIKFAMNKTRLIITNLNSDNSLSIFDITNKMKQLYPSIMTYDNNGIFDLCQDTDNCLLAYCDQSGKGHIGIIDAFNLQKKLIIDAHDSSIQIIKFNYNGNYIASASNKGTLIRIFHLYQNNRYRNIATFRRGTFNTKIQCLSFNPSSTKLCCSSLNSDTIHIFNIDEIINGSSSSSSSSLSQSEMNQVIDNNVTVLPKLNVVTDYLPVSVKHTLEFPRSCIDIQIKNNQIINQNDTKDHIKMQCGFIDDNSIVITTQNGYFYRYFINENAKQSMDKYRLLTEHSLKQNNDDLYHQQTKIFQLPVDNQQQHQQQQQLQQQSQQQSLIENDNEEQEENKETTDDIIPSPPDSPASQSPEIFNTDYQNTINENDNFKLDLQSNYT